jgi:enamine deaminase RidA (YjgF/YER057c/UK114 family)
MCCHGSLLLSKAADSRKKEENLMLFQIHAGKLIKHSVRYAVVVVVTLCFVVPSLSFAEGMIDKKLKELNISLPVAGKPIASYVTSVRTGNLLYTAGHIPYNDGKTKLTGKLGKDLTIEEGSQVARNVILNCLATIKASVGDLDKVKRIVKVLGMVNSTEDFKDQPKVMNGASDLLVQIFGEKGKHARSAVGVASLPNGAPVEIEIILEVE